MAVAYHLGGLVGVEVGLMRWLEKWADQLGEICLFVVGTNVARDQQKSSDDATSDESDCSLVGRAMPPKPRLGRISRPTRKKTLCTMPRSHRLIALLALDALVGSSSFQHGIFGLQSTNRNPNVGRSADTPGSCHGTATSLCAKKKKKSTKSNSGGNKGGMGFGATSASDKSNSGSSASKMGGIIPASKSSLESQWESYILITMMEMEPLEDTADAKYRYFELADVFVRGEGTGWYRIGKLVAADHVPLTTSLTLQHDLILWTAERMCERLKAVKESLEVGYISPSKNYQAFETDGPVDEEDAAKIIKADPDEATVEANTKKIKSKIGFRPDFPPLGFTFSNDVISFDQKENMGGTTDTELLSKMFGGADGGAGVMPPGANVLASNVPDGISSVKESDSAPPEGALVMAGELEEAMDAGNFDKFLEIMRENEPDLEEEEARKTFDLLCGLKSAVNEDEDEDDD